MPLQPSFAVHAPNVLRDKLASNIFAALVDGENLRDSRRKNDENEQSLTHLLKRAFDIEDSITFA